MRDSGSVLRSGFRGTEACIRLRILASNRGEVGSRCAAAQNCMPSFRNVSKLLQELRGFLQLPNSGQCSQSKWLISSHDSPPKDGSKSLPG